MTITPHPRGRCRLGFSRVTESSFGGGQTISMYADTGVIDAIRPTTGWRHNRELATGREGMTVQIPTERILNPMTLPLWPSTDTLLLISAFAMGRDTFDGSGTNRTHAITMAPWDAFPGSLSIEQHFKGDTADTDMDLKNNGVVIDSFTLSGARNDWLGFSATISGGGQSETAGNFSGLTNLVSNYDYYLNSKVRVSIQAASAEGDSSWADAPYSGSIVTPSALGTFANSATTILSEALESWSLTYTNPWQWTRAGGNSSGAGTYGVQPVLTRARSAVVTMNLASHSATESFIKALANSTAINNAEWMIVIEGVTDVAITGTIPRSFCYVLPLVVLQTDPGDGGGDIEGAIQQTMTFEAKEDAVNSYKLLYGFFENASSSVWNQVV